MAQHDYVIANQSGAAFRSDLNNGLSAIVSQNSGSAEPSTTYAYMWWADTTTGLLKIRNAANSAWVTVGTLATANLGLAPLASPTFTGTVTAPTFTASTGVNIPLGSAGSPSLYFTGDTNTGIYSPGADQVAITTGGTQRLKADTAAITSTLPVVHPLGAVGTPSITFTGDLNTGIYSPAADTLAFVEGGAEAMRIDSSGRLLIGTSSARTIFDSTTSMIQVETTSNANRGISLTHNINSAAGTYLQFAKTRGSGNAIVSANDVLGAIIFGGADGTNVIKGAQVLAEVDGTPGANDMPGRLVFSTTADGASSPTERFRIGSAGQLGIGGATYGTAGQVLTSGGASAAPTWASVSGITSGTAVASTSGTSIDFTSIPAGVKRVTVMFSGVSLSGTDNLLVRLGTSGGFATTGYASAVQWGSASNTSTTAGFIITAAAAANTVSGHMVISNISANSWVYSMLAKYAASAITYGGGDVALSAVLTSLRITTVGGANTFDAGSINIFYE